MMALADRRTAITDVQNALLYTEYFYVDSVKSDKLAEDAIRGMLKALDPHSTYLTQDEVKHMNEGLGGNFEGIGVRYQMEKDTLLVISTVVGGPSEKQGILAGDHIVAVNDTSIAGQKMTNKEIQRRLRGPKGSPVKITVLREGERIDFVLTRDLIPVYSVDASYMATPDVGYIRIARFAQTTPIEVEDAMRKLSKEGMENLIIDLQGNGGGYLESAVQLASLFLEKGQMIVYTSGRREPKRVHNATREDAFKGRLVVLIDEESASSSEIFTGAIQDWDRGVIVGRRSFGKGLVQRPIELPSGAMIRLTIARYFTPSGRCIQKPFTKGEGDNYHKDLMTRYKKGEFVSADSIHLEDSLMYSTFGKRIVYGGGGIMPDIFVPLDTTKITKTHRDLMAKGTINRWILAYFKENQKSLHASYESFESFNKGFNISDTDIENLCEMGKKDNINIDANDMEKSDYLLKLQLKAYLANDLYEQGAYNRIMNQRVPAFKEAVSIISDEDRYYKYLTTATSEVAKQ
jgi:carboxyl-terminal processing protease